MDSAKKANRYWVRRQDIAFLVLILALEVFFFRELIVPGSMIGDSGDARLNNLIMEHWYHVFQGREAFDTLSEFYPVRDTVSYTDMLLGDGIIYSLLRFLGVGIYGANKLTLIFIHVLGSLCLYYFLRRLLHTGSYASFIGVLAFSFANGYAVRIGHTQMMALSIVPLLLIFAGNAAANRDDRQKRRVWLWLFCSLYALLAYTGWYTFFFLSIFTLIFGIAALAVYAAAGRKMKFQAHGLRLIKDNAAELGIAFIYTVLLLVPFLMMYLPASRMTGGGRSWEEVLACSPQILDLLNVSGGNLLLGRLISAIDFSLFRSKLEHEVCEGFSVVLLAALIYLAVWFIRYRKADLCGGRQPQSGERNESSVVETGLRQTYKPVMALIIAVAISLVLVIEVNGVSCWAVIWACVPGGSSLRALGRWWYFLLLPMGILLAVLTDIYLVQKHAENIIYTDHAAVLARNCISPVLMALFAAALFVTNIYKGTFSNWNAEGQYALIESVTSPPEEARVIAFADSSEEATADAAYNDQLDAWTIADHYGLKTLNGYSGNTPEGFTLWDITADDYMNLVYQYGRSKSVAEDIWVYDRADGSWQLALPTVLELELGRTYPFSSTFAYFDDDIYGAEDWGRWTKDTATICFAVNEAPQARQELKLTAHTYHHDNTCRVTLNGKYIGEIYVTTSDAEHTLSVPAEYFQEENELEFTLESPIVAPSEVDPGNGDSRVLGLGLISMTIDEAGTD